MKKIKLILTVFLITAISVSISYGQDKDKGMCNKTPEEKTEKVMERMKTNLELTDEQYNSIYSVVLNHVTEMKSLCEQYKENREDFRNLKKENKEKLMNDISVYLTEDQKQKMEEFKKNHKNKKGKFNGRGHKKHGKDGFNFKNKSPEEMSQKVSERMKDKLNLTETQQSSIQSIFLNHFSEMKSLHESKDQTDREEFRNKMKEHRESIKNEMKTILTDEQFQTWEEMRQKHKNKRHKNRDKSDQKDDSENLIIPENNNSELVTVEQNFPNPFNPTTSIRYSIPEDGFVNLKVYDVSGKEIAELVNESQSIGTYTANFDATEYSSGIYFYQLTVNDNTETNKMLLIK